MITARGALFASALLMVPPLTTTSFAQNTTSTTVGSPVAGYSTNVLRNKHHHKVIHGLKTGPGAKAGSGSGLGESSGSASGN